MKRTSIMITNNGKEKQTHVKNVYVKKNNQKNKKNQKHKYLTKFKFKIKTNFFLTFNR